MDFKSSLAEFNKTLPQPFKEARGNLFSLEIIVAERKAFLTKQKLTYNAKIKVYDQPQKGLKEVRFFEILKESGAGISSGLSDDFSPGIGFKVEKVKIGLDGTRQGNIKEQSDFFKSKYEYNFNFEQIRENIEKIAINCEYEFKLVFSERQL